MLNRVQAVYRRLLPHVLIRETWRWVHEVQRSRVNVALLILGATLAVSKDIDRLRVVRNLELTIVRKCAV